MRNTNSSQARIDPWRSRQSSGTGFTLVEVLIAIAVMALLASIFYTVAANVLQSQRERATMATIRKLHLMLQARLENFNRYIEERNRTQGTYLTYVVDHTSPADRADKRKRLMRDQFPQGNSGSVANGIENPEALYSFLMSPSVELGVSDTSADGFDTGVIRDTDGDGRPEFVDAWGTPIRFYLWPTRLVRPGGPDAAIDTTNGKTLLSLPDAVELPRDPDDPTGLLAPVQKGSVPAQYSTKQLQWESNFHTPATYFTPLIVSAGPDLDFGLYAPTDTTNRGHVGAVETAEALMDNITNYNRQSGAR